MLIDGRPADTVPVADRAFQYGDGLFETIAVFDGVPALWDRHMARLQAGCARLGMPAADETALRAEADALCSDVDRGVLKILVSRGEGGRGYRPPRAAAPRRVLSLHDWPDYPAIRAEQGVQVRWCDARLGLNPGLAGLKHCNRLEQVLARAEWDDTDIAEGLMCDAGDRVVEGTQTNLFVWRNGELLTPSLTTAGVAGVARALLLEIAAGQGITCHETDLGRDDVLSADGLLLTNSLIGAWPVAALGDHVYAAERFPRQLIAALMERIRRA